MLGARQVAVLQGGRIGQRLELVGPEAMVSDGAISRPGRVSNAASRIWNATSGMDSKRPRMLCGGETRGGEQRGTEGEMQRCGVKQEEAWNYISDAEDRRKELSRSAEDR